MRKAIFPALATACLFASPMFAADYSHYRIGETITYHNRVSQPDVRIVFQSRNESVITLALVRKDSQQGPVQINIARKVPQEIAVKKECDVGGCRSYIVTLAWVDGPSASGLYEIQHEVRVVLSTSS